MDYKILKKNLKAGDIVETEFFRLLSESESKLSKFYYDKENWAMSYMNTLEQRVEDLRAIASSSQSTASPSLSGSDSAHSLSSTSDSDSEIEIDSSSEENGMVKEMYSRLKEEYRNMGSSKHFNKYIYAKKSLKTFYRELELLLEFVDLNRTAFRKIIKKFDKKNGSSVLDKQLERIEEAMPFLKGSALKELRDETAVLLDEVDKMKPQLPKGWSGRKVYTIGCFDLFHRGHQNVLMSLREFGCFIVAGIHDDTSYFKLKNKYTIDNLETRMENVKPFVDQLYVIPGTDPLPYIRSMVSQQDIDSGACCYARGDDMLNFPGREWVESVMPVHFVPRTESCSSTLIRTIYHAEDPTLRAKAAFAKTRYDGKPVDEDGNVLKLKVSA